MRRALTIAGSDSGGGAGIQADLKTFAAHGVYGLCAITAVTAQSTQGVLAALAMPAELVSQQIEAVVTDIGVDAVKTGMLASAAIVEATAAAIERFSLPLVVVDPVMIAKGGRALLAPDALEVLRTALVPRATVVTPNAAEAAALTGSRVSTLADAYEAARRIHALGAPAVIVKGGHVDEEGAEAVDILFDGASFTELRGRRVNSRNTHGAGCTFAAALTAQLALGRTLVSAARAAKTYITMAIEKGPTIGSGHGPVNHFWGMEDWGVRIEE